MTDPASDDTPARAGHPAAADTVPRTGRPEVDAALDELSGLAEAPLDQHHDRLSAAHERLHETLQHTSADRGA